MEEKTSDLAKETAKNPAAAGASRLSARQERLIKRTRTRMGQEAGEIRQRLTTEETERLAPFLAVLEAFPKDVLSGGDSPGTPKKTVFSLCVQVPGELFHAAGLSLKRLACGSFAAKDAAPGHLPALSCPMVKSLTGLLGLGRDSGPLNLVVPTTCDWVVKFAALSGLDQTANLHFMELPHLREGEGACNRWLGEIKALKTWLEAITGQAISRKALLASVKIFNRAATLFDTLCTLRRAQAVPGIDFFLIMNAFSLMDLEAWVQGVKVYVESAHPCNGLKISIFLSGSPVAFPNDKMIRLIENAGMAVTGDDICTLERGFPGAAAFRDPSEYSLLHALADRHHKACACPTFADNRRRLDRLVADVRNSGMRGVIFHVLKGCHPFDMEAGLVEQHLGKAGIRVLKIETDYVVSDEQNIITRLEAFSRSLG